MAVVVNYYFSAGLLGKKRKKGKRNEKERKKGKPGVSIIIL